MEISFLKRNGMFLIGWAALLSLILTSHIFNEKEENVISKNSLTISTVKETPLDEKMDTRFFPLMFFYSK